MYAIKGRSYRCISDAKEAVSGEEVVSVIPESFFVPTPEERNEAIRLEVGEWMDSVVQGNGYDNIVSCASYTNSASPKFKAEALSAIAWRDAVWAACYALQSNPPKDVDTIQEVIALLPKPAQYGWVADPIPNRGSQGEEPISLP